MLFRSRYGDVGGDLWRVFNRVQENLIRGGIKGGPKLWDNGKVQSRSVRPVRGITQGIALNADLWSLAEKIAIAA